MPLITLGIGSNVNAEKNLQAAAALIRQHWPAARFSSVYKTAPRDVVDQPDFLNAVAVFDSEESPASILRTMRSIEETLGKDPPFQSGPRTIDLDFLLYGDQVIQTKDLTIPHPRMHQRRFVLEPLSKLIDMNQKHPVVALSLQKLWEATQEQKCQETELRL